ncbi:endonuclease/exonuclease/phosphatase family protein [Massilia varians]|uniref:endonuclease/exonuclease/phosphatase family protein n=1 Tax=Massilia varians TaxID=457921 RepID=UPI002556E0E6|nr:endonuclease/exonuclease/phosphatase family protein [Massilia varians]MDK6077143.1 endonuclease/exonuclease/phosphatase family protein [Massilia varians]
MLPTFVTLVAVIVLVTLLPLLRCTGWWIRDLDFPRLQLAILSLAVLVGQFVFLDWRDSHFHLLLVANAACLAYQVWWIMPYTKAYPHEVKNAVVGGANRQFRILTANVLMPNRNAEGLIALIRQHQPDIFVTLETDAWWQERLDVLEKDYPHAIKCPLDNLYGMHVYSRLPLEDSAIQFLVEDDIPSIHTLVILPSGHKVRMHFLHPTPPSPTEHMESTQRDAELLVVAKSVNEAGLETPVIVAGDLNDVAWSTTTRLFRKISGLLDPRIGRGMFNTFHAGFWFARWPLDHLFHSEHFTLSHIERLPSFGSDHFPMLVELTYDSARGADQEGLVADEEDHELADEKIAAEDVEVSDVHEPQP